MILFKWLFSVVALSQLFKRLITLKVRSAVADVNDEKIFDGHLLDGHFSDGHFSDGH